MGISDRTCYWRTASRPDWTNRFCAIRRGMVFKRGHWWCWMHARRLSGYSMGAFKISAKTRRLLASTSKLRAALKRQQKISPGFLRKEIR